MYVKYISLKVKWKKYIYVFFNKFYPIKRHLLLQPQNHWSSSFLWFSAVSIFKVPGIHLETEVRDIFNPGRRVKPSLLPTTKCWWTNPQTGHHQTSINLTRRPEGTHTPTLTGFWMKNLWLRRAVSMKLSAGVCWKCDVSH